MSMSNSAETDLLKLIFQNITWANVGDATGLVGSTTAGSLYVSLHSVDPGEAGDQTTSELSYTGYARVAVARSTSGWDVSGNTVSNHASVAFGACTAGSGTAAYFSVGRASSGAGEIIVSGAISSPAGGLAISNGITPSFATGVLTTTAD